MRTLRGLLFFAGCALVLPSSVAAQTFDEAERKIADEDWEAALQVLLDMQARVDTDAQRSKLAGKFDDLGGRLLKRGKRRAALRSLEAALAMRRRIYGDEDHRYVVISLNNVAGCLHLMGRSAESLPHLESSLAMVRRIHAKEDHPDIAIALHSVAVCLYSLGRFAEALPQCEEALTMWRRVHGNEDHPAVARSLDITAGCLESLGRSAEALPQFEAALAMWRRIYGDADHPNVATSLSNVASSLRSLGRLADALPQLNAALAMLRRIYGAEDHPDVAKCLDNVAVCLNSLGQSAQALPQHESALAMWRRIYGKQDRPEVAKSLDNQASSLRSMGRSAEELPHREAALAIWRRLYGDEGHPRVASSLNNVACCLLSMGRAAEALPHLEAALAMRRHIYGDEDHRDVALSLNNVASNLMSLGRVAEALPQLESALAMWRRIHGDDDHPDVASSLNNVGFCHYSLGRLAEALPQHESALAMWRRIHGDDDHPDVASSLNNISLCLLSLCRSREALSQVEAALAMDRRIHGKEDHPDVAVSLNNVAACLDSLGRSIVALPHIRAACAMIERLRDSSRIATDLRQTFFDELKRGGAFDRLQKLAQKTEHVDEAMRAAERSRARRLLDLLEQSRGDPWLEAQRRASLRGDTALATSIPQIRAELEASRLESDRLLHQLTALSSAKLEVEERAARRAKLLEEASVAKATKDRLENERARVLSDVLPIGRVRTSAEIQAALQQGELLLQYTVTEDVALLYVLGAEGSVEAIALPTAHATLQRELESLLQLVSHRQAQGKRGETLKTSAAKKAPSFSTALFEALIPKKLWPRVKTARRVFIAPHRALHRLPFEALVTEVREGKPLYWLDAGPEISYVPSGTALHWLRKRAKEASDDDTALDLLAVGDPRGLDVMPELPEEGVFVVTVKDAGPGAQAGIRPGDVLVSYDGKPLTNDKALRALADETNAAIEDGERDNSAIPIGVWRRGETLHVEVHERILEIEVGRGPARSAYETYLAAPEQMQTVTRAGELERLRALPALLGARAETEAIDAAIRAKGGKTRTLLGSQASEPAVFGLSGQAKFLHFACHGVAEEYAGQSLSTLVLSQPEHVLPGEDGLLRLEDLLTTWRGRLSSCRLVVLSACRTNVGPTLRDEAPHALPIGFMYAGAPSVVSSLWAVDDASTRTLMTDFYARLMAGETDRLAAFTAAKKALRKRYPDPFHWAPFLFIGSPGS